jgi:predicted O-methyltransferase YrrM
MHRTAGAELPRRSPGTESSLSGDSVPSLTRSARHPVLLSPAARKAARQKMLLFRQASVDRVGNLTEASDSDLRTYRRELSEGPLPDLLLQRGAGLPFARELPQAALLYLMVRALRPRHVIETGVRPGYSTAWILAAIAENGSGDLTSLGPGPTSGRAAGVHDVTVGQFVAPSLRGAWTLVLGNTEDHLRDILRDRADVDLFFFDNGPDVQRARFELRIAWSALSTRGVLMAHHIDANSAWGEFCRLQGAPPQPFDMGPPPMGALAMRPKGA